MSNKVIEQLKKGFWKVIGLGPLSGYKTILAALLFYLAKYVPGFPELDLSAGVTPEQILLTLAALERLLEKFLTKKK